MTIWGVFICHSRAGGNPGPWVFRFLLLFFNLQEMGKPAGYPQEIVCGGKSQSVIVQKAISRFYQPVSVKGEHGGVFIQPGTSELVMRGGFNTQSTGAISAPRYRSNFP